jgi:8-oxo-dGTP pyrophosphatase MutT (NUDIX family)
MVVREKVQVWIYRRPLEFLLLYLRPERGSFWQPITGGVESGETLKQAAARECVEETGLSFHGLPAEVGYSFEFPVRGQTYRETVFYREALDGEVKLDAREHVASEWVSAEEALNRVPHESTRDSLRRVLARLGVSG